MGVKIETMAEFKDSFNKFFAWIGTEDFQSTMGKEALRKLCEVYDKSLIGHEKRWMSAHFIKVSTFEVSTTSWVEAENKALKRDKLSVKLNQALRNSGEAMAKLSNKRSRQLLQEIAGALDIVFIEKRHNEDKDCDGDNEVKSSDNECYLSGTEEKEAGALSNGNKCVNLNGLVDFANKTISVLFNAKHRFLVYKETHLVFYVKASDDKKYSTDATSLSLRGCIIPAYQHTRVVFVEPIGDG